MKRISFILLLIIASTFGRAQDTYKIYHNNKIVLSSNTNDTASHVILIKKADLQKIGYLNLVYKEISPSKGWKRSISFADSVFNPVKKKDRTFSVVFSNINLKKLFNRFGKIAVFTWSLPLDPRLAAAIRIRRVHLCTLQLQ